MAFCRRCGRELKEEDEYCPNCGEPVRGAYQPQQPGPAPGPVPQAPGGRQPKKGVPTIAVLAVLVAVMLVSFFALNSLLPTPEPSPSPEGGYDSTVSFEDIVIHSDKDSLLDITGNGKYFNPETDRFELDSPSNIARIGLEVVQGNNDESLDIKNVGTGTFASGSTGPINVSDICTIHLDKNATRFDCTMYMVTAYAFSEGSYEAGNIIDMNDTESVPSMTGKSMSLPMPAEDKVFEYSLSGDMSPYVVSGKILVSVNLIE